MLAAFISLAVVTFLVLPFFVFYMLPLTHKALKKDENGAYELTSINKKGLSSVVEEEKAYRVKRAENVQRIDMFLIHKVGILSMKRHYYIEFATDEVVIPKPKKGKLIKIFVTKVDGVVKNSKQKLGVNLPLLILTFVLQLASLLSFALYHAINLDRSLYIMTGNYYTDAISFYIWPIIVSILIPFLFFITELIVLNIDGPRKEVK